MKILPNTQRLGKLTFDSNQVKKSKTNPNVLIAKASDGKDYGVVRKDDGSYDYASSSRNATFGDRMATASANPNIANRMLETVGLLASEPQRMMTRKLTNNRYNNPEEIIHNSNFLPDGIVKNTLGFTAGMLIDPLSAVSVGAGLSTKAGKYLPKLFKSSKVLPKIDNVKPVDNLIQNTTNVTSKYPLDENLVKDAYGFMRRRKFVKDLQKENLIGKEFNEVDASYAARSTDKTNALTKLALDREATYYRGVKGTVPKDGIIYNDKGFEYDMSKPSFGNKISEFENMKNANVDFNNPLSIAKYQASHIPMDKYGYRSGMPSLDNVDALYASKNPTRYGDYMIKMNSPRNYSEGNYQDWFNKYHDVKSRDFNKLVIKDGNYDKSFIPNTSYDLPLRLDEGTVVGKKGQKMFDVDDNYPFMDYKNLDTNKAQEYEEYLKNLSKDYNTGWRGKYKNGGKLNNNSQKQLLPLLNKF
jgi:hypothetical protein